jgi:CDP-glucose 4,6-dehydratase
MTGLEAYRLEAYRGKRVFITGHTGFVGRHLACALADLGAIVEGFSLPDDVRRAGYVQESISRFDPAFVFHLAAQALVPESFERPRYTFETNALGTVNVLEALHAAGRPCSVVVVTTDKVYLPAGGMFTEIDHLGGHDPYACSKAAAELAVTAYRDGFFAPDHEIAVATARAGNIIGPGDWAEGRLIPNAVRALCQGRPIQAWNPDAVRPWQHVDDVVRGYLLLGAALASSDRALFCEPWNFGPDDHHTVREVIELVISAWGRGEWVDRRATTTLRETAELRIDSSKARAHLGWSPTWSFEAAVRSTVAWYREEMK